MSNRHYIYILGIIAIFIFSNNISNAQLNNKRGFSNNNFNNNDSLDNQNDSLSKKKHNDWDEEPAIISYKYLNSESKHFYDSTILFFHRNEFLQPVWYHNLGNWGSPANNLQFSSNLKPGFNLGFNTWDLYRYSIDSVPFINTTRPYTSFSFMLGSKQLQWVEFMHTQNINENWNFAFKVANNVSDGFYQIQKASGVNAYFTTNYKSKNQRLNSNFAFIINNFKNDENGGILSDSLLNSNNNNRALIDVFVVPRSSSSTTSPIFNRKTDTRFFLQNNYAWGQKDSLYNEDSTQVTYKFTPRFSIKHVLDVSTDRHLFRNGLPDSLYYVPLTNMNFGANDTIRSKQSLTSVDNRFTLNTYLGKDSQQVHIEAGIGIRYDWLKTQIERIGSDTTNGYLSNYLFGELRKDAIADNQWSYLADLEFYYTGQNAGNLLLNANLSKRFPKIGMFTIGVKQSIVAPTYQQSFVKSNIYEFNNNFGNSSTTNIFGNLWIKALKLQLGLSNQLIGNYVYLNENLIYQQYSTVFSVLQLNGRKSISWRSLNWDNEIVWQQVAGNAPINLPNLMLRTQLAIKLPLFQDRLDSYFGIQGRYNTPYKANGYSFILNNYYYQSSKSFSNLPTMSAFFNFKVKRLRMFVIGDELQQLIQRKNNIITTGYAAPNAYFRLGFNWIMMN